MKFLLSIFFLSFHFNFSSASGQKAGQLGEEAQPQRPNKKISHNLRIKTCFSSEDKRDYALNISRIQYLQRNQHKPDARYSNFNMINKATILE